MISFASRPLSKMFSPEGTAIFCKPECIDAYQRLYNLESYLRLMLRWELVGKFAENWNTPIEGILREAKQRRDQESSVRFVEADSLSLLSYLMLSDISAVMLLEPVWPLFKVNWPAHEIFESEFRKLIAVRNKNAHFRQLTARDLRTLGTLLDDISDFTDHYSKLRRRAVDVGRDQVPETFKEALGRWFAQAEHPDGAWAPLGLSYVGPYLRLSAATRTGALPFDVVSKLLASGVDCFFASLDAPSGRLVLYLPKKMGKPQIDKLICAILRLEIKDALVEVEPVSEDSSAALEYVFPIEVELPAPFRL